MKPRVCVVVLNWNQPELTLSCIATLMEQRVSGGFSVLLIDNGSTADNLSRLKAHIDKRCELLQCPENVGFATGMNIGIEYARQRGFDYVWLLNNDAFPEADCLDALLSAADADHTLVALTPRLFNRDGSDQAVGARIDWETAALSPLPHAPLPRPTPLGWYITGAALFIRLTALTKVGGFDQRFFAYWEDFDLCTRLTRSGNFHLGVVESARCIHWGSSSSGVSSPLVIYLMTRNAWLFVRSHQPRLSWPRLWLRHASLQLIHAASLEQQGHSAQASAIISALAHGVLGLFGRPQHLSPPTVVRRLVLAHFWGISRAMWATANAFAPGSLRRDMELVTSKTGALR